MSFTEKIILCLSSGLIALISYRLEKRAIAKGRYVLDRWGWANTFWGVLLWLSGLLFLALVGDLFIHFF